MKTFEVLIREASQRRGGPVALREPGTGPPPAARRPSPADLAAQFRRHGLSERAARIAAAGREGRVAEGVGIPGVPGDELVPDYAAQGYKPSDFMWCPGTVSATAFGPPLVAKPGDTSYDWGSVYMAIQTYSSYGQGAVPAGDRAAVEQKLRQAWADSAPADAAFPDWLLNGGSGAAPSAEAARLAREFERHGLSPREAAIAAAGRR